MTEQLQDHNQQPRPQPQAGATHSQSEPRYDQPGAHQEQPPAGQLTPLGADDPATRPGSGSQTGQWQGISPRFIPLTWINEVITVIFLLAITGWPVVLKLLGPFSGASWWWLLPLPGLVLLIFVINMLLTPRRVRAHCYREDADEFLVRRGLIYRRLVVVPYGRMQYVDVNSGPLMRAFGLAEITLHTASPQTNTKLPGVSAEEANRLREHLTERGEDRLIQL
ncbi:PH domain-containing protein [Kocuria sp.]|uniref:PH domain-containing protein n=1 Tax=Kocuria sp. TaxID=1871328 RepID=UPI0026DEE9A9|nr:PH domain-containing protein [Kocuria sp.]MDO5617928.1 PH domain-containing protein [Kocuria sp.]